MKSFSHWCWSLCAVVTAVAAVAPARAEPIKIGVLRSVGSVVAFVAQEKGYFAAEGLASELVFFESAQPISVATASGDIDFGVSGLTGSLFSLAGQGVMRIIGGGAHEMPGFKLQAYVASNRAYAAGVRTYKDFASHSFGTSQIGAPGQYSVVLLAEKYGFDLQSVRIMPLQSIPNIVSALVGGQADFAILPGPSIMPTIERGDVKLIGWAGEETPYQLSAAFASTKTANEHREAVERFLRAYRKGARVYHDAFADAGEKRRDGAEAPEMVAIIAKNTAITADQARLGIAWVDGEERIDMKDTLRQVAWYRSQGLVKGDFDPATIFDSRYAVSLPE
jgi:NitT/TauT family transport system substrate-binding protein